MPKLIFLNLLIALKSQWKLPTCNIISSFNGFSASVLKQIGRNRDYPDGCRLAIAAVAIAVCSRSRKCKSCNL